MLSYQFGGLLMHYLEITENDFHNLWVLIVIANSLMLIPLPFLAFVNFDIKDEYHDGNHDNPQKEVFIFLNI